MTTYREVVSTENLTVSIDDITRWNHCLILRVGDNLLFKTSSFIDLSTISSIFLYIIEFQCTSILAHDYGVEWIPLSNDSTLFYDLTFFMIERRTIRYIQCRKDDICIRIYETDFCKVAYNLLAINIVSFLIFLYEWNSAQLVEFDTCLVLCLNLSISSSVGSNTTGVECTESQLSTWLTDSLCSDDTHSLTQLYHAGSSQVAAIALHADTFLAFASEYRADFHTFDRRILDCLSLSFSNLITSSNNQFASCRMDYIVYRNTAQDTLIERRDNLITILQSCANQAAQCTTILFSNDYVMRNVYKTTGEVTCIGSLHSGIGKTLTRTVGSDKVLQH